MNVLLCALSLNLNNLAPCIIILVIAAALIFNQKIKSNTHKPSKKAGVFVSILGVLLALFGIFILFA